MDVTELFLRHAEPAVRAAFREDPELASAFQRLVTSGASSWPDLAVPVDVFVRFLAQLLSAADVSQSAFQRMHIRDLYLACAYGLGLPEASAAVEEQCVPHARRALQRLGASPAQIADILQELRARLCEMQSDTTERRGYSGRGDLKGWLFTCAVRRWLDLQARASKELDLSDAAELVLAGEPEQETALIIQLYKDPFQRAFRAAVTQLTPRERNLLRAHFLLRHSVQRIGQHYNVHHATAARWVRSAQEKLAEQTRQIFLSYVPISAQHVTQIMVAIESQLSLSLAWLLTPDLELDRAG
jgi:RNA polymerase sigma-70 factor, ECF subfamily